MAKSQRATPSRPAADALGQRAVGRPPNGTREAIVDAAVQEFAQEGLGGARIERISKRAETSDRMLYYHCTIHACPRLLVSLLKTGSPIDAFRLPPGLPAIFRLRGRRNSA